MHFGRLFFCVNDLSILHILRPPVQQDSRCGRHAKVFALSLSLAAAIRLLLAGRSGQSK